MHRRTEPPLLLAPRPHAPRPHARPAAARPAALRPGAARLLLLALAVLLAALALRPPPAAARAVPIGAAEEMQDRLADGTAHALVLGISDFDGRAWNPLPGVSVEVAMVSESLARHGFTITTGREDGRLSKEDLRRTVRSFVEQYGSRPENRLVIYFATHGIKEEGGYGLLVATDTLSPRDEGFAASAYSVAELSADLAGLRARHLFLFVNACFSGAMVPALGPVSRSGSADTAPPVPEAAAEWAMRLLSSRARLVLTAGSDDQEVPDRQNPFAEAVTGGLDGAADLDGDGLILGSELAQHVRARVALATLAAGRPNDPVYAILPEAGAALPEGLRGDFVFLAPGGPETLVARGEDDLLEARQSRLPPGQFTECADCPVMVALPPPEDGPARLAVARSETTYAEWDACYREFGCRRHLPDDGLGRGDRPVGHVTWQDALEFADWANGRRGARCERYRLPTLAEWQAAAQGARPDQAVCRDCAGAGGLSSLSALRVASLPGNALGLHDMAGNLWEWVTGPEQACGFDVLRDAGSCPQDGLVAGGAYSTRADALEAALDGAPFPRSANRHADPPPASLPTIGLRLVCDLAVRE